MANTCRSRRESKTNRIKNTITTSAVAVRIVISRYRNIDCNETAKFIIYMSCLMCKCIVGTIEQISISCAWKWIIKIWLKHIFPVWIAVFLSIFSSFDSAVSIYEIHEWGWWIRYHFDFMSAVVFDGGRVVLGNCCEHAMEFMYYAVPKINIIYVFAPVAI